MEAKGKRTRRLRGGDFSLAPGARAKPMPKKRPGTSYYNQSIEYIVINDEYDMPEPSNLANSYTPLERIRREEGDFDPDDADVEAIEIGAQVVEQMHDLATEHKCRAIRATAELEKRSLASADGQLDLNDLETNVLKYTTCRAGAPIDKRNYLSLVSSLDSAYSDHWSLIHTRKETQNFEILTPTDPTVTRACMDAHIMHTIAKPNAGDSMAHFITPLRQAFGALNNLADDVKRYQSDRANRMMHAFL